MREWTVDQYATKEGVTERTVRRWIEKGAVVVRRTPGGGVRVLERVELHGQLRTSHDNQ